MSVSEKQKGYRDKYDKENFQYITFKARKGAKERLTKAALSTGQSTNGFIRATLNRAVQEATGVPMEINLNEKITNEVIHPSSLDALFKDYDGDYQPSEYDWSQPLGKEVW